MYVEFGKEVPMLSYLTLRGVARQKRSYGETHQRHSIADSSAPHEFIVLKPGGQRPARMAAPKKRKKKSPAR